MGLNFIRRGRWLLNKSVHMKAKHKPSGQVIDSTQWNKTNFKEVWTLTNGQVTQLKDGTLGLRIKGSLWPVSVGEYIIKTIDGDLHVHSQRYFEGNYEVENANSSPMKHQ
jgi:hypothetical protein